MDDEGGPEWSISGSRSSLDPLERAGGDGLHERAVMATVVGRILELADREHASAVTHVRVRLGALSHFSPDHFREHFEDAARGTIAEGAGVEAVVSSDTTSGDADAVVLESVEVEVVT